MKHSLRFRLLFFVLTSFIVGWLTISGFTWWRAAAEADALFDEQLFQLATLLAVVTSHEAEEQDLDEFAEEATRQCSRCGPPMANCWYMVQMLPGNPYHSISKPGTAMR
ncbi:MAG: hypothetical protein OI74_15310 [Gammaproteobacteria bacterium (ex Lamellibrachia satsuma)]|nr:MAG: hypothetical protein HPY30_15300 [Gammaproteobacteria bacterium (ex Lamellibrachia satsuma)]RRS31151.1 MAG: hypothetical protein OI74_15310 [Gammaproteobacteria bacterium (ex Lamellibrachia satsuma)]RRS35473.1 MAG: hypothetical protein NV67_10400 [Gammaproteobacteria bacterium (ex Lamellibrachia satsuma)]RRS37073.1 MAG: hypothetical protein NV67_03500 [Gammaproteobacteria bacterium (ex Lamellibrachia satsuma)]